MNKQTYLAKLAQLLAPLPEQERQDALNYYEEYFDAAGPEAEDATAAELGDPADAARKILEGEGLTLDSTAPAAAGESDHAAGTAAQDTAAHPAGETAAKPASTARLPSRRLWACCWLLPPCWSWSASY